MCGIVGVMLKEKRGIDRDSLERMNQALFHRGPDEGGVYVEDGLGLGHRRLSIIDLSSGQQPMFNETKSVALTYNGEIYNYRELFEELSKCGHSFKTQCDTEAIVHAYEQWGSECVTRFRGMFAFAVWDSTEETLFIARDRLGIKPIYYALLPNGQFIFASELKALLVLPELPRELDPCAVEEYFAFGYIPEPRTILRSVRKLEPGHSLTISRRDFRVRLSKYWDVDLSPRDSMNYDDACEELVDNLREAVRLRLISEVPIGAFLSGGVDSSSVVSLMAELSDDAIKTCSISFKEAKFDEGRIAAEVAARFKTDHHSRQVASDDFRLISRIAEAYDEPFADSSALPTYQVCGLAKERVTVCLSGDGGDELFAGYELFPYHLTKERMRRMLPAGLRRVVFGGLARVYPNYNWMPRVMRARTTFETMAMDTLGCFARSMMITTDGDRQRIYSDDFRRELQGYRAIELLKEHARVAGDLDPLRMAQYLMLKIYLPGDILTKVDRASMAHALEVRVPLLDHHFVEWAARLPGDFKIQPGRTKRILKSAFEKRLTSSIVHRKKMGFSIPLAEWLRGPLKERVRTALLCSDMEQLNLFSPNRLQMIFDEHQSRVRDHGPLLWSLMMFNESRSRILG